MLNFRLDGLPNVKRDAILDKIAEGVSPNDNANVYWGFRGDTGKWAKQDILDNKRFYHVDWPYWSKTSGRPVRRVVTQPQWNWRITVNNFINNKLTDVPYDRLIKEPPKKWNKKGRNIIICPSSEFIGSVMELDDWLNNTISDIKSNTDRPIIIHKKNEDNLLKLLPKAHSVVTSFSMAALVAIFKGVPIFTTHKGSFASPLSGNNYDKPEYKDMDFIRYWLANLSWKQFNADEFASGFALEKTKEYYE